MDLTPPPLPLLADHIVDTVREPLLVLTADLRVLRANRSFYRTFAVAPQETIGRLVYELGNGQWDIPALRGLLEDVLPQRESFDDFEVVHDFQSVGRKVMLLNARRVVSEGESRAGTILLAIEDISERRWLEEERRELETRFTSLVKNVRDHSIFALDPQGNITSWNVEAERILGFAEAEVVGRDYSIIFTEEDKRDGIPERELRTAMTDGRAEDERWHERKGGERFWALGIVTPMLDASGKLTGFSKILRDMTERKRAEEALTESEQRFRAMATASGAVLYQMSADWSEMQTLDGKGLVATTDKPIRDWMQRNIPESEHAAIRERIGQCIAGRCAFEMDHRVYRPDGSIGWTRSRALPVLDEAGEVVKWFGAAEDVTERQQWVAALAETRRKLDSALIAGEVGTFEWDVAHDRLWGDRNFQRIFGIDLDASGAAPLATYVGAIHPADRDRVLEHVRRSVETGCDYAAEYRVTSTVPPRWVTVRGKVERDDTGGATRFSGVVLDETERKQAEQLLAAQNWALERMATGLPLAEALGALTRVVKEQSGGGAVAAILIVDDDGCTLRTGAAPSLPAEYNAAIDGLKAKRDVGTCADAAARNEVVITPDIAAAPSWAGLSHLPLALGLQAAWSMPIRASDGRVIGTFGTYFREQREPTGREQQIVEGLCRVAALAIDRGRAEAALRESERRFRELADAMPQMVWVTRPDGYHEYYNHRWYEFTGVPEGSTDGEGWNGMFHPDDQERAWAEWRHSLATGAPYEVEYRLRHSSGEYRWTLGRALPIRDTEGAITRWFGTCTDIDALKRLEQERESMLDRERASSRMKDEFLATLSHELRTPLNAILGWSQILAGGTKDAEDLAEGLRTIERNALAQTQIIEDLLDMSRIINGKVRLDVQRVDLAAIVNDAVATAKPSAEAKAIRLQSVLDPHAGPISGDPARLQQVMWNLLTNAIKFTPKGGRVQVLLERVNSHLEMSVSDTGEGIPPEFLPYVFDRFRQADATTTRRHGGLGLGLSIVKQLVELHGGSARVKSAGIGRGTTFTVSLPLTVIQPEPDPNVERHHPRSPWTAVPPDAHVQIAGVKVLVVDDEADARALVRRLLEDCKALVLTAGSAAEAFELVRTEKPHVLVCDIGMPGEDGYSLIRRVRALGPEHGGQVPAAALTAYARAEDRVKAILAGFQMHLAKPVEPAELIATVAGLAGRTGQGSAS